jgi:hypothetical protein
MLPRLTLVRERDATTRQNAAGRMGRPRIRVELAASNMQSSGPLARLRSPRPLTAALGGTTRRSFMTESEISR